MIRVSRVSRLDQPIHAAPWSGTQLGMRVGMSGVHHHSTRGYTFLEVTFVVAIMIVLAGIAWPLTSGVLDRIQLVTAMETIRTDIRSAQREARATGRAVEMRVDPRAGSYTIGPTGTTGRLSRLPAGLTFGTPDGADPDGVTFRDNIARFSARPGLHSSLGSITVRSRAGAKRITVSLTGFAAITTWDGHQWS